MKLTKKRLNEIIKEEIERVLMKEASSYVLEVLEVLKSSLGVENLLKELSFTLTDSELMQSLKSIARKHNIDLTKEKEAIEPEQEIAQEIK